AVVALRDHALPRQVLERVVLGVNRHAVLARDLRDRVRDRPGDSNAVALQAQVPVQARGAVLLDYEAVSLRIRSGGRGLRRSAEVALAPVLLQLLRRLP